MGLKIAVGVAGRFHADELAIALGEAGHDTRLFTTLPKTCFSKLPAQGVRNHIYPEIVFRLAGRLGCENLGDRYKILKFGKFLAKSCRQWQPNILIAWSDYALEAFREKSAGYQILVRDSLHIQDQFALLEQEYKRFHVPLPDRQFVVERECEEYALADEIFVISDIAKQSFIGRGVSEKKIHQIQLGVDSRRFLCKSNWKRSSKLRVVYFGQISLRKGIPYLLEAFELLSQEKIELVLIGAVERVLEPLLAKYPTLQRLPALPQEQLAKKIREFDVFVLPSIEDGFGQVVVQAMASGLVPVVTDHCGSAQCVSDGFDGFVIPARNSAAIVNVLERLASDPELVTEMGHRASETARKCSWERYREQIGTRLSDLRGQLKQWG